MIQKFISSTIGRMMPRYRVLNDWLIVHREIIATRQISPKTIVNRLNSLRYLSAALGEHTISKIRPHQIAAMVQRLNAQYPSSAARLLVETRDVFDNAVAYGWIDRNPAAQIKAPRVRVARQRLTLDAWRKIHAYAAANMPPWVARMMVLALVTAQRRSDLQAMRFEHAWDDHLHVEQQKTGARLALPVLLTLDEIGVSIAQAIDDCRGYARDGAHMLRRAAGRPLGLASLSARFETAREGALGMHTGPGAPASLHECRSLSERLYRKQGIDTRVLLGHKRQAMTDVYNDDRGLSAGQWQVLSI